MSTLLKRPSNRHAPLPGGTNSPQQGGARASSDSGVDRKIIGLLLGWAAAFPQYEEVLVECAEEISRALVKALGEQKPIPLKIGYRNSSQMILTAVQCWADLHTQYRRAFQSLIEEINQLDEPVFTTAIGKIYHLMKKGYQTIPELSSRAGYTRDVTKKCLTGLIEIGLVDAPAPQRCAKRTEADGNPPDIYTLKQYLP
jgi:hypothetical protein